MISVEEENTNEENPAENPLFGYIGAEKKEDHKVASLETDEIKLAELRLASMDRLGPAAGTARPSDESILASIKALLGADSEQRNAEVYQGFLESYNLVTRMAAALCSYWNPDAWFIEPETPSPDQHQRLDGFCAEFLDCLKVMQGSLNRIHPAPPSHLALLQAIRRFLGHFFQLSSKVLEKSRTDLELLDAFHLKPQIALVNDLVHLLGQAVARMIMVAKSDMAFPHQLKANWTIQSAVPVPARLQSLGFPPNLLMPQFVTGNLIVANADFL